MAQLLWATRAEISRNSCVAGKTSSEASSVHLPFHISFKAYSMLVQEKKIILCLLLLTLPKIKEGEAGSALHIFQVADIRL